MLKLGAVFTAHHEDDQVEQVLVRINNHTGAGLAGMHPRSQFAECHDMLFRPQSLQIVVRDGRIEQIASASSTINAHCMSAVHGSLIHYRPLLGFSKQDLISTCTEFRIGWEEDATNLDHRLTMRNAIRKLLREHRLPHAVERDGLLRIRTRTVEKLKLKDKLAALLAERVKVTNLDISSGKLTFEIEHIDNITTLEDVVDRVATGVVLRELVRMVSPKETVRTSHLSIAIDRVFCDTLNAKQGVAFTTAGVIWKPIEATWLGSSSVWELTREPSKRNEHGPVCSWDQEKNLELPIHTFVAAQPFWTWQLFDGRFWIRARAGSQKRVFATLFQPENSTEIAHKDWRRCVGDSGRPIQTIHFPGQRKLLRRLYFGDLRGQVPVLMDHFDAEPCAFPTVGIVRADMANEIFWEVQYRQVDIDLLRRNASDLTPEVGHCIDQR